jgi:hypothetical protein
MVKVEVVSRNLVVVHEVVVNYDQTPAEAMKGLPNNDPLIADYPQYLWSGGKVGIVEGVSIPIHFPRRYFTTAEGRKAQSEIGYGLPAEIAALKGEDIRRALRAKRIWALVALCQSNEQLWWFGRLFRLVSLRLAPDCHGFSLDFADNNWSDGCAVVGAPQVPK